MNNLNSFVFEQIEKYKKYKKPIEVDFKQTFPKLNNLERGTHLIHPYPAKLLVHIPYLFLNNDFFSKPGDYVLDPFCGSGTVLLESILARRRAIGADSNPLARLISKTKTTIYNTEELLEKSRELIDKIDKRKRAPTPNVVNIDYWFLPNIKRQLTSIKLIIDNVQDEELKNFYNVSFSNLIKKVSLADPRISVPVRLNPLKYSLSHPLRKKSISSLEELNNLDVRKKFQEILLNNVKRFARLEKLIDNNYEVNVDSIDARELRSNNSRKLRSESVQLLISSPPYCGAQKYVRSSSLSLGWLNFTEGNTSLRELEELSVGREHYYSYNYNELQLTGIKKADKLIKTIHSIYPKRAFIASNYLIEMKDCFKEATRVLKKGGYLILVAGSNQICGYEFKTQQYLAEILENFGLKPVMQLRDNIKSYGLMTKRNKTASIITCEWILVFQK